ncbi:hypothetical protein [Amycolatopsis jejuensis]|uniref:hypothetical protein n=1 Tax=Amycolatopsis jejuensis TaxID=330084 RepID=UPI0005257F12|nr:hypothetical protein [Amycolatopsis jejuensis]
MSGKRAENRQYEGDYYGQTHTDLTKKATPGRFGVEDQRNVRDGVDQRSQHAAADYSVTQGEQLVQGQSLRGDAPSPDANYASHQHQDLYNMVHTDMDPRDIDAKGRVANKLGNWLADLSNAIDSATKSSGISWQGDAAEQAHGFFQQTAAYTAQTASAAQLSSNRYSQQAAAADYAQKNMPEPTGFDQKAEMDRATSQISAGNPFQGALTMNGIAAKQEQADAAHQQAVQVLQGLDNTYHGTATTQPAYSPPPQLGGSDSGTHVSSAQPISAPGGQSGAVGGPGGSAGNFSGAPGQLGSGSAATGGGYPPAGGGSSYTPGVSTGAGSFNNPAAGGGYRAPTPSGFGRISPEAMALGAGAGVGGAGEDTVRGRSGSGGNGGRGVGGNAGSRVTGGTPKPGEGNSSGKGAGERLERGATAAANAGKAGKPGAPGVAGTGAGKKKEEDKEHKNKIPTQIDPDEVFEVRPERGPNGEKITPPVLGG